LHVDEDKGAEMGTRIYPAANLQYFIGWLKPKKIIKSIGKPKPFANKHSAEIFY